MSNYFVYTPEVFRVDLENKSREKMNNVVIIQSRINSQRLPKKAIMYIGKKMLIERVIERVKRAKVPDMVVLATTCKFEDKVLCNIARELEIGVYKGEGEDVLSRYLGVAEIYGADNIVRITGDCALVSPAMIDMVLSEHLASDNEYTSNVLPRTIPKGFDIEVIKFEVLEQLGRIATEKRHREHVTLFLVENAEKYKVGSVNFPWVGLSEINISVDTMEDLELVRKIYGSFDSAHFIEYYDVIKLLQEHPQLVATKVPENVPCGDWGLS